MKILKIYFMLNLSLDIMSHNNYTSFFKVFFYEKYLKVTNDT